MGLILRLGGVYETRGDSKEGKNIAGAALEEYLTIFAENLERFRIEHKNEALFDDQVVANITEFAAYRNELLQVVTNTARYLDQQEAADHLHRFLESILRYQEAPENLNGWRETDFDNYKFIIHEIFLYTITICLKYGKLLIATQLLDKSYYVNSRRAAAYLSNYECFYNDASILSQRNQRLQLNRTSLSADLTKEFNNTSGVDFSSLMQTDFLLFVRCEIHSGHWWPKTLVYLGHYPGAFEIFTRSASAQYFENLKKILKVTGKDELEQFVADATQRGGRYYGFSPWGVDWKRLMNLDDLNCLP